MTDEAERKILDMVEQGDISAEDGLRLMNAMARSQPFTPKSSFEEGTFHEQDILTRFDEDDTGDASVSKEELARIKQIKRWWILPFGVGLLFTILGAVWMYAGYTAKGFGVGFWLSWIPFLLGVLLVAVSYQSSHSIWLHVRIRQRPGEKPERIAISLPIPISITRWFLKSFGDRIPGLREQPIDFSEVLENISPEEPFYVHVDEDGEEVEVIIG